VYAKSLLTYNLDFFFNISWWVYFSGYSQNWGLCSIWTGWLVNHWSIRI